MRGEYIFKNVDYCNRHRMKLKFRDNNYFLKLTDLLLNLSSRTVKTFELFLIVKLMRNESDF